MNTLKFYPKKIGDRYVKNIRNAGIDDASGKYHNRIFWSSLILTVIVSTAFYFLSVKMYFAILFLLFYHAFFYFKISLQAAARIKQMETVFPDVVSLMASNLRSGITIDKAFLLAARPEFHPLDEEILRTGKDITTGQDIIYALKKMSERVESEKIDKVVMLIISGLKAGGNMSDLLEHTARNMKKREILEKKSRSTILMYVIFIFFAVGIGAPVLFGLSSVLVEIIIELTSKLPETASTQGSLPFTFQEVSISLNFVIYFSMAFIIVSDFISSMVMGLVRKGDSNEGLKYFLPLVLLSIAVFFLVRILLSGILLSTISGI